MALENVAMRIFSSIPDSVSQSLTASYFRVRKLCTLGLSRQFHSQPSSVQQHNMRIRIIPALEDNYMYLLVDEKTSKAAVVDPVEPVSVLTAVKEEGVVLEAVLTTHHHWDHAGGNEKLVASMPAASVQVLGGDDRIGALTRRVAHGDRFTLGSLSIECLFTPCHTSEHICYYVTAADGSQHPPVVFTGDTLFQAGCGRFFEGTAQQMYKALVTTLGQLPDDTQVFCGHEYTLQNLKFAAHVEPSNVDVKDRLAWAKSRRESNEATIPSTIGMEKKINPFVRVDAASVQEHTGTTEAVETMTALRKEKDHFKAK